MEKTKNNNHEKSELSSEDHQATSDFDFKWENKSVLEIAESNFSIRGKSESPEIQNKEEQEIYSMESSPDSFDNMENQLSKENIDNPSDSYEEEEKIEEEDFSKEKRKDIEIDLD